MRHALCFALMASAGLTQAHAETITVSDGDFENWTFTSLASNNGSATATVVDGGNPGVCVNVTTVTPDWGDIGWGIAINDELTWDPAQRGPIAALRMEIDVKSISFFPYSDAGQALALIVCQDGRMYGAPISRDDSDVRVYWNESCLTGEYVAWGRFAMPAYSADAFAEMTRADPGFWDFDSQPDFSANGSPIQFGFGAANHVSFTYTHLYDNWELTVVPEPGVIGLLLCGLLIVAPRRRVRR